MEFPIAEIKKPPKKPRPYGYPQGVSQTSFGFSVCCDYNGMLGYVNKVYFKPTSLDKAEEPLVLSYPVRDERYLKDYWSKNGIDKLEGIYIMVNVDYNPYRGCDSCNLALLKAENGYELIFISNSGTELENWSTGDTKAFLFSTDNQNIFKAEWFMLDKTPKEEILIENENDLLKLLWLDGQSETLIKIYPTVDTLIPQSDTLNSSEMFSSQSSFGQDIIVKRNGEEINSKVLEISTETIKYKEFDFQDGPTRIINIYDVFMIIYGNGKREIISTEESYPLSKIHLNNYKGKHLMLGLGAGNSYGA